MAKKLVVLVLLLLAAPAHAGHVVKSHTREELLALQNQPSKEEVARAARYRVMQRAWARRVARYSQPEPYNVHPYVLQFEADAAAFYRGGPAAMRW